ncbi:hypothetical protein [Candidatus Nanohalococcus occultus]|uniref:hypothetical protein n=1 Tax=Candidatus Nanohalococcus occultus TaxID=2978047 RepID=UPI0039E033E6
MAYRASQRFEDPESAIETLEKLPENGSYKVHGSMYSREPSTISSEHSLEEAVRDASSLSTHLKVTLNYDDGKVKISGKAGVLPVSSMKGDFEPGSWQDFKSFLEENGDWK